MSKKKKKQDIKDVVIDADHILYALASPPSWKSSLKGKKIQEDDSVSIKHLKNAFKERIESYTKTAETESITQDYKIGTTIVVISDESNFRYDIFPDYKANRKGKKHTDAFMKLRKWARKKFSVKQNVEADDVVAWYVRNGAVGFTEDKDLLKGVEGIWFDCYHTREHWVYTSAAMAERFNLLQYVAGDLGDGILGIVGIGFIKAEKLLDAHGWNWKGVVNSYIHHGYTKYDAILTRRLVSMKQWSPDKGLQMYKGEK